MSIAVTCGMADIEAFLSTTKRIGCNADAISKPIPYMPDCMQIPHSIRGVAIIIMPMVKMTHS